jgi:hypothetical protein
MFNLTFENPGKTDAEELWVVRQGDRVICRYWVPVIEGEDVDPVLEFARMYLEVNDG